MNYDSVDELGRAIASPNSSRLERMAAAFALGRISGDESLAVLLNLAKDDDLVEDVSDEVGRSLARVALKSGLAEGLFDPHAYHFTPAAFDSFDQEVAIRNFLEQARGN